MALLFSDGFENGDDSGWSSSQDATINRVAQHGSFAAQFPMDETSNNVTKTLAAQTKLHLRAWLRLPKLVNLTNTTPFTVCMGLGGTLNLLLQRNGTALQFDAQFFGAAAKGYASIPHYEDGAWQSFELFAERNGGADTAFVKWMDVQMDTFTPGNTADNFGVQLGALSGNMSGATLHVDSVEIYDDENTGAFVFLDHAGGHFRRRKRKARHAERDARLLRSARIVR